MSKPFLIVAFLLLAVSRLFCVASIAQENAATSDEGLSKKAANEPVYPLALCLDGDSIYVVDLDLPGVWKAGAERQLFIRGSKYLRKPLNRPRCVIMHPAGGILVADSATRDIYHIAESSDEPIANDAVGLTEGHIGIPMAMAISADKKTLYVGDAEKRATFKLPIDGGSPELVARVNARGFAWADNNTLLAVTPDANAVVKINVETGEATPLITERPYQYPNGIVWSGDEGYVTDGYGKAIWKFSLDGKTEKWHEGEPLVGPVGIAISDDLLFVADPKQKQIYQFDRKSKEAKGRF
ncbi:hypothetical protein N9N28_04840 [Rubripirellula amarantea]|nr:hypothetical protein [Rubripirellula amarantea]